MTIQLAIADDEATVRAGLRMLVDAEPDLEVVGEASDGNEIVELARRAKPDVVLMDIRMARLDGISAMRQIRDAGLAARVIMLTTFGDEDNLYEALSAGASGFLLKVSPPERLLEGIRVVAAGESLLDPAITRNVIERFAARPARQTTPPGFDSLTPREREVMELVARGLSNTEIATQLVLSETTVKTHVQRILMKLGLRDRVQAVVLAYEHGLITPGKA